MGWYIQFFTDNEEREEIWQQTYCHNGVIFTAYSFPYEPDHENGSTILMGIGWFDEDDNGPTDRNNEIKPGNMEGRLTFYETPPDGSDRSPLHGYIRRIGSDRISLAKNYIWDFDWDQRRMFEYHLSNDSVPYTKIRIEGSIGGVSVCLSFKVQLHRTDSIPDTVRCRSHLPYDNPAR